MNNPFDRMNIGLRERPLSSDLNRMQSQHDRTIREVCRALLSGRASNTSSALQSRHGFIGTGFRVVPSNPAAMSVQVSAGHGFMYDAVDLPSDIGATDLEGVDDLSPYKPVALMSPITFAVPAAPGAPNSRIDIIEVKVDRRLENALTRRQLDVATKTYLDHSFFKTLAWVLDGRTGIVTSPANSTAGLSYKIGTAANPGTVPATTAGYVKIAQVHVSNTTITITGAELSDWRPMLGDGGIIRGSISWRQRWNAGTPIVDIKNIIAPPGVDVGITSENVSGAHNSGVVYIVAGNVLKGLVMVQGHECNSAWGDVGSHQTNPSGGVAGHIDTVRSGNLASFNAAGLLAALTQPILGASFQGVVEPGNNASAHLDDMMWEAMFMAAYH